MSKNKTFLFSLLLYAAALLAPSVYTASQGVTTFTKNVADFTTLVYVAGAILLLILNFTSSDLLPLEKKRKGFLNIILWGISGIFLALILQTLAFLVEQKLFGLTNTSENTAAITQYIKVYPIFLWATSLGGPIMEELIFRRGLVNFLVQKFPLWLAISLSSILFAFAHNDGHLLVYFSIGILFCCLYKKTGTIWTSILTHCGMNLLVILVQFYWT